MNMNQIDFIPGETIIKYAGIVSNDTERKYLLDAVNDFWLTYGKWSQKFEDDFKKKLNVRYAYLVNSGSSANLLAFMTLTSPMLKERQIKRGDEVITVAACFPTTVAPMIQYGAVPVFVDVDKSTANIDISKLEAALTEKTKAIMIAHTLGNPFDLDAIKSFCENHKLWLVEDNCDALGSKWNGTYTGTIGDIGTSSFYPAHHITTGEGGMTYTNNPILSKIMLSLRDWGRDCWCSSGVDNTCGCRFTQQFGDLPVGYDHKYVYSHFGYNLKATEFQAAIGCAQLEKLDLFVEQRKMNYEMIKCRLENEPYLRLVDKYDNADPSWFGALIEVVPNEHFSRNDLTKYLEEHKIQTRNLFAGNILRHPCFGHMVNGIDYRVVGDLLNTDCIMNDFFWIGVYPGMTNEKIEYMISTIKKFISSFN
jgi:CDP-6-deoxy-D-xylo-4-hexulose-3-dehydrase